MGIENKVHYRACNLCEAICGLEITTHGARIISIKGDHADPFSRGHICPKAVALADIQNDPDRLRSPVKRVGSGADAKWVDIGWDEAIELVTDKLSAIRQAHGSNAIGSYQGNPSVHNYGMTTHANHLLGLLRTQNRFSASSVDQLPHQIVAYWLYGHQLLLPIPDIDHTGYLLMLGANPIASNGSIMTVPDVGNRLKALKARGGKLVVIDPRRTETADIASEHHFIRPGTDAAFLFAVLNTIFEENLCSIERLAPMLEGLDAVREAVIDFTPEAAAVVTGIDAGTTRRIAREFAAAPGAVCYGRMGVSTQRYGTLCQWAIQLINIATGNLDRVGGALVTKPAFDFLAAKGAKKGSFERWFSRVRKAPEVAGELPAAVMAEEILTPGDGQIRALITMAGNPVLSTPNGPQLERALGKLDFMVSFDIYINETTRFAHVILPSTSALEHDHYDITFNLLAVRNVTRYNAAMLEKPEGALHDWEILTKVGDKLAQKLGQPVRPTLAPHEMIDLGLQSGPYGTSTPHQLSLHKLKEAPHGIDLGPLAPSFPQRLMTDDQRIHCAHPKLLDALREAHTALLAQPDSARAAAQPQMLLIGRRHVRSNNSWMHNFHRLVKGKDRSALMVNPADMQRLGLSSGQHVSVTSRTGAVNIAVQESSDIMQGVVSIPHGWGHTRRQTRMQIAALHPGVSANDLTDDQVIDAVCGNAALNGVKVTIENAA